ncbi:FecR family protein [Bradyrhizobium canariense]|uniref:FecR family protein n=1 Tax=Bradyrhizobium canariense TaxID=255045 RepID=A0A1H1QWK1_9BRAD|nr:FecR domain-containing protein [Bradyrhizobium canariense]SDS27844.1 FecR family protein [Bradyrhizobium canariense]
MKRRAYLRAIVQITLFAALAPPALAAPEQIGLAVVVRNDVSQVEPTISKIISGDDIVRDELVRTNTDSSAKFVLRDSTNLLLGPNSTLKLDRAVFAGEKGVGDVAVKLTLGSFRFITGNLAKESYAINTPLATLGVRGTTLDFLVQRLKNTVVLKEGQAHVCAGGNCIELTKVGEAAVITSSGGRIEIVLQSSSSWSFDASCGGMCSQTTFAQAEDSLTTGSIGGAGSGGGSGGPTGVQPATGGANTGGGGFPSGPNSTPNGGQNLLIGGGIGSASFSSVSPH